MKAYMCSEGYTIVIEDGLWNGKVLKNSGFSYEPHIRNWIYEHVPGKVLVNVGANYGIHVLNGVRAGAKHVLAFEVIKEVNDCLLETIKLNNIQDKVSCYNVGIGDRNGVGYLRRDIQDNATVNWGIKEEGEREVEVRTLPEYLAGFVPEDIIFLMDAEGSEFHAMQGMGDFILGYKPRVVFEVLPHCITREEIVTNINWLCSIGYTFRLFDRPNQTGIITGNAGELITRIYEIKDSVMDIEIIP